ncbi:MAG: hypothetical protein WB611_26085 [Stellaceae bacterium]
MKVHFVAVSQNAKTGSIPVSITERASCWPGCALYENGCYAETGALVMYWRRVSTDLAGGSWAEFLRQHRSRSAWPSAANKGVAECLDLCQ